MTATLHSKGQIISEQNCGVLGFPKKQRNYTQYLIIRNGDQAPQVGFLNNPPI